MNTFQFGNWMLCWFVAALRRRMDPVWTRFLWSRKLWIQLGRTPFNLDSFVWNWLPGICFCCTLCCFVLNSWFDWNVFFAIWRVFFIYEEIVGSVQTWQKKCTSDFSINGPLNSCKMQWVSLFVIADCEIGMVVCNLAATREYWPYAMTRTLFFSQRAKISYVNYNSTTRMWQIWNAIYFSLLYILIDV